MLTVDQAQDIILRHATPSAAAVVPLSPQALGLVLAEAIASDLDMPPFDKAMMDGFALRSADLRDEVGNLVVTGEINAGQEAKIPVEPGQAARIMTGAPVPAGADAVVMVEHTRTIEGGRVHVEDANVQPGQHILKRGREMAQGETVLRAGAVLRPQELGLLASVGRTSISAIPFPRIALLSTGDELVEAPAKPGPGQIRNSNGPMLLAQAARAGAIALYLGIAPDDADRLAALVGEGLHSHVLILSGGVSAGKRDLVPGVLEILGVQTHFHKVAMKPGKPVLFGTRGKTLVFGLPGNPVSAFVCFELFVRPAIRVLAGHAPAKPPIISAHLTRDFFYSTDRPTYRPASLARGETGWEVEPVSWFGSPDLKSLTQANSLAVFPVGDNHHQAGQAIDVVPVDDDLIAKKSDGPELLPRRER